MLHMQAVEPLLDIPALYVWHVFNVCMVSWYIGRSLKCGAQDSLCWSHKDECLGVIWTSVWEPYG